MSNEEFEAIVAYQAGYLTEEALREQDGKKVPLTAEPGGPVIGEVTLQYDPDEKALKGTFRVDDPKAMAFLKADPSFIFEKES